MKMVSFGAKVICLTVVALLFSGWLASASYAEEMWEGWAGEVFAGYNQSNGNTEKASGSMTAKAVKDFDGAEFTLKSNIFYSESDNSMDGQKWDALAKFSYDFGAENQWFNFYQVFVDHDYFADIDYRVTPSVGIGYHLSRTEEWTWDVDAGLGYRITRHRINEATDDEVATALVHTFMNKRIFTSAFLSEDFTLYPSLESDGGVTLKSETAFTNPISEKLDLEIKYIVDYDYEPAEDKKKTDTQFIAGVKYKF